MIEERLIRIVYFTKDYNQPDYTIRQGAKFLIKKEGLPYEITLKGYGNSSGADIRKIKLGPFSPEETKPFVIVTLPYDCHTCKYCKIDEDGYTCTDTLWGRDCNGLHY